ncbi:DUF5777 family beta-barrel protein [Chitinophaga pinensis]|uniref:DUF5777 domain-containing protein n=1 Tax=Chitinophaga pinensis (strain ATCC 43595 / DSM 2588 / LMG 13176 / NBRC 15968 / NCIMB 11800 / UQM 2034) TaxID=485918 RepID=A0A979GAN5_CHIPD|nr:DUF5777 family beta-barrel protein [Chitinophaga pinensis]ACU63796.1 hypothetical protein Cpin_6392 [Chitinophaga pinensis DSM 2588]
MQKIACYIILYLLLGNVAVFAQDTSLLKMLDESQNASDQSHVVTGTFKATQLINVPTVESPGKQSLQFLIMHRFGKLNEGAYELFGLDNASIRFGLDYGFTDRLSAGVGRSSVDKAFDGNIKYKILQQSTGKGAMPISLSLYELVTHYTQRYTDKPYLNSRFRTSYTSQLLIARKFSRNLSLQLAPSWTHYNLVATPEDNNDLFAITAGGRMKFTKRMSVTAEYSYLLPDQVVSTKVYNSLSLGVDIETGGHVFQLVFTNSNGMIGPYYLSRTNGSWGKGDIFFGFNISRSFNFKK